MQVNPTHFHWTIWARLCSHMKAYNPYMSMGTMQFIPVGALNPYKNSIQGWTLFERRVFKNTPIKHKTSASQQSALTVSEESWSWTCLRVWFLFFINHFHGPLHFWIPAWLEAADAGNLTKLSKCETPPWRDVTHFRFASQFSEAEPSSHLSDVQDVCL